MHDLFQYTSLRRITGIAVSKEGNYENYLAFIDGEPEGAIYIDESGSLYSDKAVMMIKGHEKFELYDVKPDVVDAVVMGSRIFEKTHLRKSAPSVIQEIGKKSEGIGVLRLTILKDTVPQNGVNVSIRSQGKILGSDITTDEGDVSFKLSHGKYECIVMDRAQTLTTFFIKFDDSTTKITLDLNVKPLLEI